MARNVQVENTAEEQPRPEVAVEVPAQDSPRAKAMKFASGLAWLPGTTSSETFAQRCARAEVDFAPVFAAVRAGSSSVPEQLSTVGDNFTLISAELRSVPTELAPRKRLVHVRTGNNDVVPRVLEFAEGFLGHRRQSLQRG